MALSPIHGTRLRTLIAKAESVNGTAETPLAADFDTRIFNLEFSPYEIGMDDEGAKDANGTHAETLFIAGETIGSISFACRMNYGASAAAFGKWSKFAKACGMGEKAWTTAGISLLPRTQYDTESLTMWIIDTELGGGSPVSTIYKFKGCVGNMVVGCDGIGKPWMAKFAFKGCCYDVFDGSALALTAPDATHPEIYLTNALTINSIAKYVSKWSMDCGNDVQPLYDQSDATGVGCFCITARKPRFTCDPLSVKQATEDVFDIVTAETPYTIYVKAPATSSHLTVKVMSAQLIPPKLAAREGFVSTERTYRALANGVAGALIDSDLTVEDTWELMNGARA